MKYLLIIVYLFFTTSGIFLLKAGGNSIYLSLAKGIEFKMNYITLVGFLCYLTSFLLWQKLLVTYDLSYIFPVTAGISQVIILLIGVLAFQEKVNWMNVLGVMCVAGGVMLIAAGKK